VGDGPRLSRAMPLLVLYSGVALMVASCRTSVPSPHPTSATTLDILPSIAPEIDRDIEDFPVRYYHSQYNVSIELPLGWGVEEFDGPQTLAFLFDPETEAAITCVRSEVNKGLTEEEANEAFLEEWLGDSEIELTLQDAYRTAQSLSGWLSAGFTEVAGEIGSETARWGLASVINDGTAFHLALFFSGGGSESMDDTFLRVAASLQFEPMEAIEVRREAALYLSSGEPITLDPALTHYGASGMIGDLFSGLVALDAQLEVRPGLAENWEVGEGGTLYTFHLHSEARFHNGRPVTAEDVLFSWQRAAHPNTGSETVMLYMGDIVGVEAYHNGQVETIDGVEVIDDHTLQVRIEAPVPYFLAKLTYPVAWVVDRYNVVLPNWESHPNGTGPFRHLQHLEEEIFILERNPWYYNEAPRLEYVVYLIYAGYTQRLFETGEVDYAGLTRDQLDRASDPNDGLFGAVFTETDLCTYYVTFNTRLPPFDDPNVRRGFVHAVDRERYVEAITNGEAVVGRGLLPPGMPGYSDEIVLPNYDPGLARELIATSPYYDGSQDPPPIIWTLPTSGGYYSPAAAFLVDTWEEVLGVTILVEGIDWESYNDQIDAGLYGQLLNEGWCADYPDPENFLDVLFYSESAQNHAYYTNPAFDTLIEKARAEPDIEERLKIYREAEQILVGDAPLLILHHSASSYGVWKSYIKGYIPSPIGVPQHASMWVER
jgi:oligopeptide transport system substrate-binding protein